MTGSHVKDIKQAFHGACHEASISDLTFHDLRHIWSMRAAVFGPLSSRTSFGSRTVTVGSTFDDLTAADLEFGEEAASFMFSEIVN